MTLPASILVVTFPTSLITPLRRAKRLPDPVYSLQVARGYLGDGNSKPVFEGATPFDILGKGYQRPMELATLRLFNMVGILQKCENRIHTWHVPAGIIQGDRSALCSEKFDFRHEVVVVWGKKLKVEGLCDSFDGLCWEDAKEKKRGRSYWHGTASELEQESTVESELE
jgi:hypothetical protein